MDTDDGIRQSSRERLTNCIQCGRILETAQLLFCSQACRQKWLRARGLLLTRDEQRKQSGRTRRGLEWRERKESDEYIQRLAAS
jgi:hypothetical protein